MQMYYDRDANLDLLKSKKMAIIGYGSQGHAQGQNLRDSGMNVMIAELEGTPNHEKAVADGWTPVSAAEAAQDAGLSFASADRVREEGMDAVLEDLLGGLGDGPLYLTLDLDVLDPSHAPGVQNPEPWGLSPMDVRRVLDCVEHGDQVVELEDETDLPAAQLGECVIFELAERLAVNEYIPLGWSVQAAQQIQQCGFSAAAGAHNRQELARFHAQRDVIERGHGGLAFAVHFGQVFRLNESHSRVWVSD